MKKKKNPARTFGTKRPILADGRRVPDRREISLRWLAGACLTGVTSTVLMAVALSAAVDGRQRLAAPAAAFAKARLPSTSTDGDGETRGNRLVAIPVYAKPSNKRIINVPTVVKQGDRDVIHYEPFSEVKMALAANYGDTPDYPAFDPFAVFATGNKSPSPSTGDVIYDADVEGEVELKTVDFPLSGSDMPFAGSMSEDAIASVITQNENAINDAADDVSMLGYVDPDRFDAVPASMTAIAPGLAAHVVDENVSVSPLQTVITQDFSDDILAVRQAIDASTFLKAAGYPPQQADDIAGMFKTRLNSSQLDEGDVVRIGLIRFGKNVRIARVSLYRKSRHLLTMALNDQNQFVPGTEPPLSDAVANAANSPNDFIIGTSQKPVKVYDGIYRAALSYGLTDDMVAELISLLASKIDLQATAGPDDHMELFFSDADPEGRASATSELFYIDARIADNDIRLYRYRDPKTGEVDYFDQNGESIKQFLLRKTVPNGVFTSGFGMRRHPVLKYARMHPGVDWAAPVGTPIIAAGDGVVEKAGWDGGGYGNQTIIRHANGYETSYNHQSKIESWVKPGVKVKQGQVIGRVGATGLVTGAHLHYEVIVNGTKVDPMKVRFPNADPLTGDALVRFDAERDRIDALLGNQSDNKVASR
ncbi:M23 family metallopeptidase [Martelella sp. HB161492]|uniref:M23 family metallopeptidase n=1 Tax=Martelella sp. HB161492 TaxID=2720726 RepID=UPI001591EBE6|nr:M23 family metallopeptidase [Martelella sp. HB161492]